MAEKLSLAKSVRLPCSRCCVRHSCWTSPPVCHDVCLVNSTYLLGTGSSIWSFRYPDLLGFLQAAAVLLQLLSIWGELPAGPAAPLARSLVPGLHLHEVKLY